MNGNNLLSSSIHGVIKEWDFHLVLLILWITIKYYVIESFIIEIGSYTLATNTNLNADFLIRNKLSILSEIATALFSPTILDNMGIK